MRRSNRGPDKDADEPMLFDLPLAAPERDAPPAPPATVPAGEERPAPRAASPRPGTPGEPGPRPAQRAPAPVPVRPAAATRAGGAGLAGGVTARGRFLAGAADLLVHLAAAVAALAGARMLGVEPERADAPALALFLLAFSFLYTVVPLAFWGQTLGMSWAGLVARNENGEPLSFEQTALRWLGALATALTAGLALLAAGRRSPADRLSRSATYPARGTD